MWTIRSLLTAMLLAAPASVAACIPWPSSAHAAESSLIAYGLVAGDAWDRQSTGLYVNVVVKHVRNGSTPERIKALSPCELPIPGGEPVIIFKFGDSLVVYPASLYERILGPAPAMTAKN